MKTISFLLLALSINLISFGQDKTVQGIDFVNLETIETNRITKSNPIFAETEDTRFQSVLKGEFQTQALVGIEIKINKINKDGEVTLTKTVFEQSKTYFHRSPVFIYREGKIIILFNYIDITNKNADRTHHVYSMILDGETLDVISENEVYQTKHSAPAGFSFAEMFPYDFDHNALVMSLYDPSKEVINLFLFNTMGEIEHTITQSTISGYDNVKLNTVSVSKNDLFLHVEFSMDKERKYTSFIHSYNRGDKSTSATEIKSSKENLRLVNPCMAFTTDGEILAAGLFGHYQNKEIIESGYVAFTIDPKLEQITKESYESTVPDKKGNNISKNIHFGFEDGYNRGYKLQAFESGEFVLINYAHYSQGRDDYTKYFNGYISLISIDPDGEIESIQYDLRKSRSYSDDKSPSFLYFPGDDSFNLTYTTDEGAFVVSFFANDNSIKKEQVYEFGLRGKNRVSFDISEAKPYYLSDGVKRYSTHVDYYQAEKRLVIQPEK